MKNKNYQEGKCEHYYDHEGYCENCGEMYYPYERALLSMIAPKIRKDMRFVAYIDSPQKAFKNIKVKGVHKQ